MLRVNKKILELNKLLAEVTIVWPYFLLELLWNGAKMNLANLEIKNELSQKTQ
jgi:hypothetical protein